MGRIHVIHPAKNGRPGGPEPRTQKKLKKNFFKYVDFELLLTTSFEIIRINHTLISNVFAHRYLLSTYLFSKWSEDSPESSYFKIMTPAYKFPFHPRLHTLPLFYACFGSCMSHLPSDPQFLSCKVETIMFAHLPHRTSLGPKILSVVILDTCCPGYTCWSHLSLSIFPTHTRSFIKCSPPPPLLLSSICT